MCVCACAHACPCVCVKRTSNTNSLKSKLCHLLTLTTWKGCLLVWAAISSPMKGDINASVMGSCEAQKMKCRSSLWLYAWHILGAYWVSGIFLPLGKGKRSPWAIQFERWCLQQLFLTFVAVISHLLLCNKRPQISRPCNEPLFILQPCWSWLDPSRWS